MASLPAKRKYSATADAGKSKDAVEPAQKRSKFRDARHIAVQTSDKALKNGELDVDKFVKAREWEIKALEAGMKSSK